MEGITATDARGQMSATERLDREFVGALFLQAFRVVERVRPVPGKLGEGVDLPLTSREGGGGDIEGGLARPTRRRGLRSQRLATACQDGVGQSGVVHADDAGGRRRHGVGQDGVGELVDRVEASLVGLAGLVAAVGQEEPELGAGHSHVEESFLLLQLLLQRLGLVIRVDGDGALSAFGKGEDRPGAILRLALGADEDDGELQSLADMHGHDLDRRSIGLEAMAIGLLVHLNLLLQLLGQQVVDALAVQALLQGSLLEFLGDLQVVGQSAFPIYGLRLAIEQSRLVEQSPEELTPRPLFGQRQPALQLGPQLLRLCMRMAVRTDVQREEAGGLAQCTHGLALGLHQHRQYALQVQRLVGLVDASLLVEGVGDTALAQGVLIMTGVDAGAHQDAEVVLAECGLLVPGGLQPLRVGQAGRNLPGGKLGHAGDCRWRGAVAALGQFHRHDRCAPVGDVADELKLRLAARLDGVVGDLAGAEPVRMREEVVEGVHQGRGRAKVGIQRGRVVDLVAGAQVGIEVGATEAIDRLLRIAHDDQCVIGAFMEELLEDGPLLRVGILKFVDEGDTVARAEDVHQFAARVLVAGDRAGDATDHVVESEDGARRLLLFQTLVEGLGRAGDQRTVGLTLLGTPRLEEAVAIVSPLADQFEHMVMDVPRRRLLALLAQHRLD